MLWLAWDVRFVTASTTISDIYLLLPKPGSFYSPPADAGTYGAWRCISFSCQKDAKHQFNTPPCKLAARPRVQHWLQMVRWFVAKSPRSLRSPTKPFFTCFNSPGPWRLVFRTPPSASVPDAPFLQRLTLWMCRQRFLGGPKPCPKPTKRRGSSTQTCGSFLRGENDVLAQVPNERTQKLGCSCLVLSACVSRTLKFSSPNERGNMQESLGILFSASLDGEYLVEKGPKGLTCSNKTSPLVSGPIV